MSNSNLKVAIAVVGVANTGKTTLIDTVRKTLLEDGWDETCRKKFKAANARIDDESSSLEKGDVKIAFCPRGDSSKDVEDGFDFAIINIVQIIVFSRRTKGEVVSKVDELQKKYGFKIIEIRKNDIKDVDKIQELIALINESIKDMH